MLLRNKIILAVLGTLQKISSAKKSMQINDLQKSGATNSVNQIGLFLSIIK